MWNNNGYFATHFQGEGVWDEEDILYCLSNWDNKNFITGSFWSDWNGLTSPTEKSGAIICALYGTGPNNKTAYTRQWDYNYNCPWTGMDVVYTNSLSSPLNDNTIYVLNFNAASTPQSLTMGKCTAIVSQYGTILKKVGIIAGNQYSILDGIELR
jgi:hypothetical protein